MIDLSRFTDKEELFRHLHQNKSLLIAQKKSQLKHADAISFFNLCHKEDKAEISNKAVLNEADLIKLDAIRVKSVINTTNLFDSHNDVHINGIWNKSVKEQYVFYLVKEHIFNFDNIISDEVEAQIKTMTWIQLGFNWEGKTQALIFDSIVQKSDNHQMFDKYVKGKVRNHSVGMQYVKVFLAINSDESDYKEEKEVWDKYFPEIINKEDALERGYFWAVTEAKIIEGSAVTRGSNWATPTQSVCEIKGEPSDDTHLHDIEPPRALGLFEKIGSKI